LALEVVRQIIDTEKEGEELIKKAQSAALDIQRAAREEAESIISKARLDGEEYYKNTILKFEAEAKEASKPMFSQSFEARKKLSKIPAELYDKAVNMVIERIVYSHGNS
jgi:vacuolar-type H+-ATPase subunit H